MYTQVIRRTFCGDIYVRGADTTSSQLQITFCKAYTPKHGNLLSAQSLCRVSRVTISKKSRKSMRKHENLG